MPDVGFDGAGHIIMKMKETKKIQPLLIKGKTKTILHCM
jgi:hypothetical protein